MTGLTTLDNYGGADPNQNGDQDNFGNNEFDED